MRWGLLHVLFALVSAPLLAGVINRTKAFFGGRHGPSLFQLYYDIFKLLRKDAVYSRTTSWIFRAAPPIELAAVLLALIFTPLGSTAALLCFPGDLLLVVYALGLMRFLTISAALDTGSAFEGMAASREVQLSALAEVALLLALLAIAAFTKSFSLSTLAGRAWAAGLVWPANAILPLVSAALLVVLLAENARLPFDDPNTHLELTMIHEAMILDHCGVDLAFIEYASALKMWILSAILVSMALPLHASRSPINFAAGLSAMIIVAFLVGYVESVMARLRLIRTPQLLVTAGVLSFLAVLVAMR